jgi:MFS superfamily sulfate permease-like transporter
VGVFWSVFVITGNAFISAFTALLLEVTFLLFRTNQPTSHVKHYDFAGFETSNLDFEDAIVYKMEGNLSFLFLQKHKEKILGLSERNVLVDARSLVAGFDANYTESYRQFVQEMTASPEKRVEFFGFEGLVPHSPKKWHKVKSI